jgi:hypothetical protein
MLQLAARRSCASWSSRLIVTKKSDKNRDGKIFSVMIVTIFLRPKKANITCTGTHVHEVAHHVARACAPTTLQPLLLRSPSRSLNFVPHTASVEAGSTKNGEPVAGRALSGSAAKSSLPAKLPPIGGAKTLRLSLSSRLTAAEKLAARSPRFPGRHNQKNKPLRATAVWMQRRVK